MAVGDASSGFLSFHQVAPEKELLMKKIYESIILRTEDYTVVDLKKEYTDPVGGIQFVIISESSEQELLQRFGDEIKKYSPYVVTDEKYLRFLNLDYERQRAEAYRDSEYRTPYSIGEKSNVGSVLFHNNMSLEEMVEIKEQYERIISIINRLPQKEQKRRIKKYLFDDKTQDEIALEEGVDQAAVCRSIQRAKENIKKMLGSGHI